MWLKVGGEWISTLTLENLINMHPKVQEVVVFAAQSEKWGERPVVLLVPKDKYKKTNFRGGIEGS